MHTCRTVHFYTVPLSTRGCPVWIGGGEPAEGNISDEYVHVLLDGILRGAGRWLSFGTDPRPSPRAHHEFPYNTVEPLFRPTPPDFMFVYVTFDEQRETRK